MVKKLDSFFSEVEIPRIKHGNRQILDTLISEETILLAKCIRLESKAWSPKLTLKLRKVNFLYKLFGN